MGDADRCEIPQTRINGSKIVNQGPPAFARDSEAMADAPEPVGRRRAFESP